jgi:heat shock protein HslJ
MRLLLVLVPFALALTACRPTVGVLSPADFRRAVAGTEWELVELQGRPAPVGVGGRRATIRFDADSARVTGFAGCNRYFGSYSLGADEPALTFGAVGMTRMACTQGMDLERQLGDALTRTTRYTLEEGRLTLRDATGPQATFVRRSP